MFKELSPLLTKRSLVLTLTSIGDERIRVTITPRPTSKDEAKELAQPFAVEGTAEELDTELPQSIVSYTAEHLTLECSLKQVKANMEAALKEAKDEAAKKVADAKKGSKQPSTKPSPAEAKSEVKEPAAPGLFDTPSDALSSPSAVAAASPAAEESEEDESENSEEGDEAGDQPEEPVVATTARFVKTTAQAGMFDTHNEEEEILQEAFYGTQDSHIAA
jgi:PRTRC genetic system protein E